MVLNKKEWKALGFDAYYWKRNIEAQTYAMDDKEAEKTMVALSQKTIDANEVLAVLHNALDCINDRITAAYDDDSSKGTIALLEHRHTNTERLINKIEKLIKSQEGNQ